MTTNDSDSAHLPEGLYERLVTQEVADAWHGLRAEATDPASTAKEVISIVRGTAVNLLTEELTRAIADAATPSAIAELVNRVLLAAETETRAVSPAQTLLSIASEQGPAREIRRPNTPLNRQALVTNKPGQVSMAHELRRELESADAVDVLVSFVMTSGIGVLRDVFNSLSDRGVPVRLITTTYMGVTDRLALESLAKDHGVQIRVDYDGDENRLHAKAWIIHRNSGHSTAYLGSSNMSKSALMTGSEWNVRLSRVVDPALFDKLSNTFNAYWDGPAFHSFDPAVDADRFDRAVRKHKQQNDVDVLFDVDVEPRQHQRQMLEDLAAARELHDRHKNLVVAATGTGKTILSALDYAARCAAERRRPKLLFVAHREEILRQSLYAFRAVLKDGSFGELWTGNAKPSSWHHVFASIQTLSGAAGKALDLGQYEWVIVDEFHHAAASSYVNLINRLEPLELVGLTATPERTDGVRVQDMFFDGRIASELRLWDAMELQLLSPFNYFGVGDDTDLSAVSWSKGRYKPEELSSVLITNEDARNALLMRELKSKVGNLSQMRALIFCASVEHAERTKNFLNSKGLKSACITGETDPSDRRAALAKLKSGDIQAITSVDVLGEGVDIPAVDTVVMLRPTESPLVFLQQLGRGLRRSRDKEFTTVLDFVMAHRSEYRSDLKFVALTGASRSDLKRALDEGFPYLPAGCTITLDKLATENIFKNIKNQLSTSRKQLVQEVAQFGTGGLIAFLNSTERNLSDIYGKWNWTELALEANILAGVVGPLEKTLLKRVSHFRTAVDPLRQSMYRRCLSGDLPAWEDLTVKERRLCAMFVWNLMPDASALGFASCTQALSAIAEMPLLKAEIEQMLDWAMENAEFLPATSEIEQRNVPLMAHTRYSRYELLAALDYAAFEEELIAVKSPVGRQALGHREGVSWAKHLDIDLLLVTLGIQSPDSSPADTFADYSITQNCFQWESQPKTSSSSATGQRYASQAKSAARMLLAVRESGESTFGFEPYLYLGLGKARDVTGSRPIHLKIDLEKPMPAAFFLKSTLAAIA